MLKQTWKLTAVSLNTRLGTSSIIVIGIGGGVAVLVGLLAMAEGFRSVLEETGEPDRALVLRTGASDEITSWLTVGELAIVSELSGVKTASGELFVVADLVTRSTGQPGVAITRGLSPGGFQIRPEIEIVRGRNLEPGKSELIAGVGAVAAYEGLELGAQIAIRNHVWTVVGHFRGAGAHDSEIWMDLATAQSAFRREGSVSSIRLHLASPKAVESVAREIEADPRLPADLIPEARFYREQSEERTRLIESLAYLVAGIMAIGAVIAAYSTMHTAVTARAREIATLRALGFSAGPVVASVLVEALALALLGGVLGGGVVYLVYDGYAASTLNGNSLAQIAFEFAVTRELLGLGLGGALALGVSGGLVPAVTAARAGIAGALRGE